MRRRRFIAAACGAAALPLSARTADLSMEGWALPERFSRPDVSTDEGGLWAMMDREEARIRRSPFLFKEAALREYLQGLVCKLAQGHCPDVRVYLMRTPFFNASMAPNGAIQIWSGLLLRVDNEAQLAAVLGHELGHYFQRHSLMRLRDIKDRAAVASYIGLLGPVGLLGQLAVFAGAAGFSRDHEREADAIGLSLMRQAGYDMREASKIWVNLQAELAASFGGDPSKSNIMFATHPQSKERSETLARLAESSEGGFVGEAELAKALQPVQYDLLEDELGRGQYGQSLVLFDRKIAAKPQRSDFHYFRAELRRLRAAEGDAQLALNDLQTAINSGQEPPQTYRCLGYLLRKQNSDGAREAFAKYLERLPQAPDAGLIRSYLEPIDAKDKETS
nr:M48 family metallopeptidase [uncultured Roseateles sp.]